MNYQVGDRVVHWNYGLGKVIAIEDKNMGGQSQRYYCVEVGLLTLWVPVAETGESPIRPPAEAEEFAGLFDILQSEAEELPEQQFLRRNALKERLQKHTLAENCRVIRDLRSRSRRGPLSQTDSATLSRIEEGLIGEWVLALGVSQAQAVQVLEALLTKE